MLIALKEKGQGLVEYAIILALIAIVVIAVMTTLGKKVNNTFNGISNSLTMQLDALLKATKKTRPKAGLLV